MLYADEDRLLHRAVNEATDTKAVELGEGVLRRAADVLRTYFGGHAAALVADRNTWEAAGRRAAEVLRDGGIELVEPVIFDEKDLPADYEHVDRLRAAFAGHDATPIAVGSGTINDLAKLAAHECGRRYVAVATAASMDGYTAFGASITRDGVKQTLDCPAPAAVIADVDVLSRAPAELNGAGYGDLAAKVTAGADWIVADALGIEPLVEPAWSMVQERLGEWIAEPAAVRRGEREAVRRLTLGLLMTGFAMQSARSSRPASGAEHQLSHLWDMQGHTHRGRTPLHGHKVAIGTLVVASLYEHLLGQPLDSLSIVPICRAWPSWDKRRRLMECTWRSPRLRRVAIDESKAKYVNRQGLAIRLRRLRECWPELRERLQRQLIPLPRLLEMLNEAGVPTTPEAIGISVVRLRQSVVEAQQIRRRYTTLDLTLETGFLKSGIDAIGRAFC